MKKLTCILLLAMLLILTACGRSKAASEADALIASIGPVTLDSGDSIARAERAVAALASEDKKSLGNLQVLSSARSEYDRLVKENELKKVDDLIASINPVTLDSGDIITKAEQAVASLTSEEKGALANLGLLSAARNEYDELVEEERALGLLTGTSWIEVYEGDEYRFNRDGTGFHDKSPITFTITDGMIETAEGAAGTRKASLQVVERNSRVVLIPSGSDSYYAAKSDYKEISKSIREEYIAELTGHEAWAVHKGSQFVMYLMFYKGGKGAAVLTAGSYAMEWEFADNNTLKITVITNRRQSATYDIVVANGKYKLVSTGSSNVVATPHN